VRIPVKENHPRSNYGTGELFKGIRLPRRGRRGCAGMDGVACGLIDFERRLRKSPRVSAGPANPSDDPRDESCLVLVEAGSIARD